MQIKDISSMSILLALVGFYILIIILMAVVKYRRRKKIEDRVDALANSAVAISPEDFFRLRNQSFGGRGKPIVGKIYDFPGVYILYNQSKNMFYVGQGQKIFDRVNNHFTGKGNGDVYADYKYGDEFTIKMIGIQGSGYLYLNDLERDTIGVYDSYATGYNKTRGNR